MASRYTWIDIPSVDTGIVALPMNVARTMSPIPTQGADLVELWWTCVNATGGALITVGNLQARKIDTQNAGTYGEWHPMPTRAIAAGVETWSNRSMTYSWTAAVATYYYRMSIDDIGPADQFRIAAITTAAAGATDLITVTARVRIPVG